ncbi:MAG: AbrB/MazE/SpoVT family DNA-binding domain-containing protein [Chloroflexota bacterium]
MKVGQQGTVTLPEELRNGLDETSLLEVVRRDDGVIELRPHGRIDPEQAWFWTERWQQMEREADADFAAGRYKTYDDVECFLADLEASVADGAADDSADGSRE